MGDVQRGGRADERRVGTTSRGRAEPSTHELQDALPRIRTDAIPVDQLRPQPEGTVAMLSVRKELDGRIQGFGSRFWSHVQDNCPRLREQFEQDAPLVRE